VRRRAVSRGGVGTPLKRRRGRKREKRTPAEELAFQVLAEQTLALVKLVLQHNRERIAARRQREANRAGLDDDHPEAV
jgi:hypothetical protein